MDPKKLKAVKEFLAASAETTQLIHNPIIDPYAVMGLPNPSGLGRAREYSFVSPGLNQGAQSTIFFEDLGKYHEADGKGQAPYFLAADINRTSSYNGAAEYGAVRTAVVGAVCSKISDLHGGIGAVMVPSGLSAIVTTMLAFSPRSIAVPEGVYFPLRRFLEDVNNERIAQDRKPINIFYYEPNSSKDKFEAHLENAKFKGDHVDMVYIEAPVSGTFEIPDINGIIQSAKARNIRTIMDNTWASHVRFKPIKLGIDIVIQAVTKYEGGYGDTTAGIIIASKLADLAKLASKTRFYGIGAIASETCNRLYHRLDSTEARINQHHENAMQLMDWFEGQEFVADILSPALTSSPYYERCKEYFNGKGNGLFTIRFNKSIRQEQVNIFIDALKLFKVGESWGGHVSLVLPVSRQNRTTPLPDGVMFRFHAGLEDANDLIRDLMQAAKIAGFSVQPFRQRTPYNKPSPSILAA